MKNKMLSLLVAVVCFVSSEAIAFDLLNRRRTSCSFRELYEDNAEALNGSNMYE